LYRLLSFGFESPKTDIHDVAAFCKFGLRTDFRRRSGASLGLAPEAAIPEMKMFQYFQPDGLASEHSAIRSGR
jgi:hypothetical protein